MPLAGIRNEHLLNMKHIAQVPTGTNSIRLFFGILQRAVVPGRRFVLKNQREKPDGRPLSEHGETRPRPRCPKLVKGPAAASGRDA